MNAFSFRPAPSYRAASPDEQMTAAFDMPMSLLSTLGQQAKGGILDSFGLGTAVRTVTTPETAPVESGSGVADTLGAINRAIAPENMIRRAIGKGYEDSPVLDEDKYKASAYYREGVKWDPGMTEDRAAALAESFDAKRVRDHFASKRPITAFLGNIAGQALDPINYIPIMGQTVKAANVARFGRVGGAAITNAIDAAANTALAGALTYSARKDFGDDITWQSTVSEIAMSALIGGAFGGVSGVLDSRRAARAANATAKASEALSTLKNVQDARIALNSAIDGLVRGEDVNLSANAIDPIERMANKNSSKFLSETGTPITDMPEFKSWFEESKIVSTDGSPLVVYHGTKANFDQFDIKKFGASDDGLAGKGFYFTYNPEEASGYALNDTFGSGDAPNVIPAYVSLKNPLVITDMKLPDGRKVMDFHAGGISAKGGAAVRKFAEEAGHDGVIFARKDGGVGHVVAFEPGQIKSIFNRGSFSRSDPRLVDTSAAKPEPLPVGRAEAEARVSTPENYKAISEQYRVNPDDGTFIEQADVDRLRNDGRLTPDDEAALVDAEATYENGVSYGEALKAVVGCLLA